MTVKFQKSDAVGVLQGVGFAVKKGDAPAELTKRLNGLRGKLAGVTLEDGDAAARRAFRQLKLAFKADERVQVVADQEDEEGEYEEEDEDQDEEEDQEDEDQDEDEGQEDETEDQDEEEDEVKTVKAKRVKPSAKAKDRPKGESGKSAAKDRFGFRMGSLAAAINAKLSKKPKTIPEIRKESGVSDGYNVFNHLKKLIDTRAVVKKDDAYSLRK